MADGVLSRKGRFPWSGAGVHAFLLAASAALLLLVRFDVLDTPVFWATHLGHIQTPGDVAAQTFQVRGRLSRISLLCGTNGHPLRGVVRLILLDEGGRRVWRNAFPGAMVRDGELTDFPVTGAVPPGVYKLQVRFVPGGRGDVFTLYWNRRGGYPGSQAYWNGIPQQGNLVFRAYHRVGLIAGLAQVVRRNQMVPPWGVALLLVLFAVTTYLLLARLLRSLVSGEKTDLEESRPWP